MHGHTVQAIPRWPYMLLVCLDIKTCTRQGRRPKIFSGFPKGWKQNSRGLGGHSPPDAEGYIPFSIALLS